MSFINTEIELPIATVSTANIPGRPSESKSGKAQPKSGQVLATCDRVMPPLHGLLLLRRVQSQPIMRMLVENSDDQTATDPSLLRIMARAHHIQARLIHNTKLTVHDIAREERASAAYIYSLLRLPWLAPKSPRPLSMAENRRNSPPRH